MRMEGVIESRGPAYPDNVGYGVRANGGHGLDVTRLKRWMDETPEKYAGPEWAPYRKLATDAVGYAQQFLSDHQLLPTLGESDSLEFPADYAYVTGHKPVGVLLPTTNLTWYRPKNWLVCESSAKNASPGRTRMTAWSCCATAT